MSAPTLVQVGARSWLIPGPTNVGVIEGEEGVYLIDSGNDKDAGRIILKLLRERGWKLRAVVNTHSNADHIGGNRYLQDNSGCEIWATLGEAAFINTPEIEAAFLWGGYAYRELRSKFFEAKASKVTTLIEAGGAREGLSFIGLRGHFFDQVGVISPDGVFYMGDGIFGASVIEKHRIPYIYDVAAFRESLARIGATAAARYIPSHGEVLEDVSSLVALNLAKATEVEERILGLIGPGLAFEDILAGLADSYGLSLDAGQYVLAGNTTRSFLACLQSAGRASFSIVNNKMVWQGLGA